jgi:hypothetical protein
VSCFTHQERQHPPFHLHLILHPTKLNYVLCGWMINLDLLINCVIVVPLPVKDLLSIDRRRP